jgi:hypothetical protein
MTSNVMADLAGNPLRTVNAHPAPSAAQFAAADELDARSARFRDGNGVCTENMGGVYEAGQIATFLSRQAAMLRAAGYVLVMALWDVRSGVLVGRPVETRYGKAYPHVRDGKREWIDINASDRTLARRGYEWVGAWVPASQTAHAEEWSLAVAA